MASEKIIKNNKKDQEEEPLIKGFETDDSTLTTSANVSKDNKHTIKKLDKKKQAEKKIVKKMIRLLHLPVLYMLAGYLMASMRMN
ncbi:uncharacterized protein SCDLUD_002901 [Saccharomycodes ludwigii]|uniref:uncharacterized protein n=1 Tax=Saccharomycodes ludwigii TaxID=36035 RepID=UPI001E89CF46|nr:hypothetical protein SCDLUD_002901 [Saccharomycodes ludwigii]KAH3901409.1 hypothetical protein SCDLUD_002901 [Saccharomycodes ludwigii]